MPSSVSASTSKMGSLQGRRKGPASPPPSYPSPTPFNLTRIKLSVGPSSSHSGPSSSISPAPLKRKVGRPKKTDPQAQSYSFASSSYPTRKGRGTGSRMNSHDSDSSDLTPPEDGDEDEEDDDEMEVTPRRRPVGRPKSSEKGKGKEKAGSVQRKKARTSVAASAASKVTISGPAGRERRRVSKIEDAGRRRARDAKFDVTEDAFAGSITTGAFHIRSFLDSDSASSFGDDESDHAMSPAYAAFGDIGHESDDDETKGLPEAFAGQEIEDLAYGAGPDEAEIEQEVMNGWFEEEDEEMFISHLSGSEADQQSQSSAHGSPAASEVDSSTSESEAEDQVDEYGLPIPLSGAPCEEAPGLVLMENWDGKLMLYQTKPEKPKRRPGSRGSRTNGSVAGSTIAPSDQMEGEPGELHLMIDPEAMAEYDNDETSSEEWSGESDEMDGDTTDSMDEEDMPMLDSPAMQELIDQQIRLRSPSIAEGLIGESAGLQELEGSMLPPPPPPPTTGAPAIIITDTTLSEVSLGMDTPALTSTSTTTMTTPQTPINQPIMGTFLPTSTDPAQHAVIDGSRTSTKSPFTHRRRSRKNRADSVSSVGARSVRSSTNGTAMSPSIHAGSMSERKRKSNSTDPFGAPMRIKASPAISKKARYTSIPGHPKYLAAKRQAEEEEEREYTSEEGEIDLEDMLDPALLHELAHSSPSHHPPGSAEHMRHLIRFDRVPVSAYIKRNFKTGSGGAIIGTHAQSQGVMSSPIRQMGGGRGHRMLPDAEGGETLVGIQTRMVVSPLVRPEEGRGTVGNLHI